MKRQVYKNAKAHNGLSPLFVFNFDQTKMAQGQKYLSFSLDHVYMIGGLTRRVLPHLSGVPHLHINRTLSSLMKCQVQNGIPLFLSVYQIVSKCSDFKLVIIQFRGVSSNSFF